MSMEGKKKQASRRKYHYIYKTTCLITNRYYIGMHSTDNLEDGYQGSGKRLWRSINKYGRVNHQTEILEFLPNREQLKQRESKIVNEELISDELCMNLQLGGGGGFINSNHYDKFTEARKLGYKKGLAKQAWLKENDEEWYGNYKKALSKNALKHELHLKYDWTGKSHSKDTKQKMSESAKLRTGNKNSQFGTCWIYNNETKQCIKIKNTEIDSYLSNGWTKGRKIKF
jgi:hypothetical protein